MAIADPLQMPVMESRQHLGFVGSINSRAVRPETSISMTWTSLFTGPRGCVRSLPNLLSLLSVDALDSVLSNVTFCKESGDALFELILGLGSIVFGCSATFDGMA
jgi:hypothetical protein